MQHTLAEQNQALLEQAVPGLVQRRGLLQGCIDILVESYGAFCRAVSEDYGHRSEPLTLGEIQGTLANLKYTYKHLGRWMRPERRPTQVPLGFFGARSWVEYQPKGVVGVVSPWNFPIKLSLVPMGEALATGNRIMLKPSEYSPKTSALLRELVGRNFAEDQVVNQTSSGGVTINDIAMHPAQLNLPFGGVGGSGMGRYHGHDGFKNFSRARAVFKQRIISPLKLIGAVPPHGDKFRNFIENQLKK